MSLVADSVLFDTAVNHLLHLPETLEKLVFPSPPPEDRHSGAQGRPAGEVRSFGGVPVDIMETPKEYTFFLDVPGLSKTDIQVEKFAFFSVPYQANPKGDSFLIDRENIIY